MKDLEMFGPRWDKYNTKVEWDRDLQREKWDRRWLAWAEMTSKYSKDPSTQVGAVIIRPNNTLVSSGYNGFPRAMEDKLKWYKTREEKYSRIIHAEMNALLFAKEHLEGYTLYTYPFQPCNRCAVMIIQSGITRVVSKNGAANYKVWEENFEQAKKYFEETGVQLDLYD